MPKTTNDPSSRILLPRMFFAADEDEVDIVTDAGIVVLKDRDLSRISTMIVMALDPVSQGILETALRRAREERERNSTDELQVLQ